MINRTLVTSLAIGLAAAGLAYHIGFSIAASIVLALLVIHAWPEDLDLDGGDLESQDREAGG